MALPIEAQSLSTLINLAANPPQYPRNVTHEPLQPLTLYIVRVPGSQDVFLTPLRPPTRASISADAITTSLYYLHVATAQDLAVQESERAHQSSPIDSSPTKPIQRKPLPNSPPTNETPQQLSASSQSYPKSLNTDDATGPSVARKPMGPRALPGRMHSVANGTIRRKPVGSTEGNSRPRANTEGLVRPLVIPEASQADPPRGTIHTEHPIGGPTSYSDNSNAHLGGGIQPTSQSADTSAAAMITVIRRDPTSGTQWNIGSITFSNDASPDSRRIEVRITTPGYQKFSRESSWPKLEDVDIATLLKNKDAISPALLKLQTGAPDSPESQVFTRYLTMPRSRASRPRSSRGRSSSDPNSLLQSSLAKVTTPSPATRPPVFVPQFNSTPARSQEHFSFLSPWNGRCTFSTAMDGRSLKARHIIPSPNDEDNNVSAPVVVELRFNLPWPSVNFGALRKRDTNADKERVEGRNRPSLADTAKSSWKSSMQRLRERGLSREAGAFPPVSGEERHHGLHSPERQSRQTQGHSLDALEGESDSDGHDHDHEHEPLDLSLGREKAGGGRGGQAAKLGKLIIRDEGLKMMDLIVAAGMGVWWGIHHREK